MGEGELFEGVLFLVWGEENCVGVLFYFGCFLSFSY